MMIQYIKIMDKDDKRAKITEFENALGEQEGRPVIMFVKGEKIPSTFTIYPNYNPPNNNENNGILQNIYTATNNIWSKNGPVEPMGYHNSFDFWRFENKYMMTYILYGTYFSYEHEIELDEKSFNHMKKLHSEIAF